VYYYTLQLARLLTITHQYVNNPDKHYCNLEASKQNILIHQARYLISQGSSEITTWEIRRYLYGNDDYIARRIANYLSNRSDLVSPCEERNLDKLLELISSNASLDGIDAVGRLYESSYSFGYEYVPDFNIDEWKQNWENFDKYPPVPFQQKGRLLLFVIALMSL
jgi:hypothetical protein